jgi:hypothetical protein
MAIATINELLSLSRQAADYWAESYEFDDVWMELAPACEGALVGYARIIQMRIPELTNPYGQPFFSPYNEAVMEGLSLIVEREPLWRAIPPGQIIGPLYNLIRNPDFELWNFGVGDSQPDSWTDLETIQITGSNNQQIEAPHSGNFALQVRVSGSTATGRIKGVTQVVSGILDNTEYTAIAWVRSAGVSNGVGRILITYSSQLELYRRSISHGWELFTGKITTGVNDVVAINCEILTTAANTDGTVYFDSLMILQGDWEQYAIDKILPYMTSGHITNHWDQPVGVIEAGDINYVDVWDIPGNVDSLIRLEVQNNTVADSPGSLTAPIYAAFRIGQRRTNDVNNFSNFFDPGGLADTASSSDSRISKDTLNSSWQTIATNTIVGTANTKDNEGRFRLLVRVFDRKTSGTTNLQLRLQYFIGAANVSNKILDAITVEILNNWTVTDITPNAAMIWDTKFAANFPSQLGYIIQARRPSGTDGLYLDYVLTMPTDGGYIDAELDPAVTYGNALIVDNTNSFSVSATNQRSGWRLLFNSTALGTGAVLYDSLFFYQNTIYAGFGDGEINTYDNNIATNVYNPGLGFGFGAFAEFNGALFFSQVTALTSTVYEVSNNVFPGTARITSTTTGFGLGLKTFNGKLYAIMFRNGGTVSELWSWDGTTAVKLFTRNDQILYDIEIYRSSIFITGKDSGGNGILLEYNISSGVITTIQTFGLDDLFALKAFDDRLFFSVNGQIYYYDGLSTTLSYNATFHGQILDIEVFNNQLYAAGLTVGNNPAPIISMDSDGVWQRVYDISTFVTNKLLAANGQLYAMVNNQSVHALSIEDNSFAVANYSGVPFTAPPKKRHRYFFSYNREDGINNIDDAAQIGIGFVPRYLALRGNR